MISEISKFFKSLSTFLSTYSVIKRIVNGNFFFLLRYLHIECIQMKLTVAKIWLYLWRPRVVTHWLWHLWTWLICLSGHSWNYFPGSICNISEFKFSIRLDEFFLETSHYRFQPDPEVNEHGHGHVRKLRHRQTSEFRVRSSLVPLAPPRPTWRLSLGPESKKDLHRRTFALGPSLFFPLHSSGQYLNVTRNLFPRSFLSCF